MTAQILEGTQFVEQIRLELAAKAAAQIQTLGFTPELAIIAWKNETGDSASDVYTRQLRRAAKHVGIASHVQWLRQDTSTEELLQVIQRLNAQQHIRGIMIQAPIPSHIQKIALKDAIDPDKDVDGAVAANIGNLFLKQPAKLPATCLAVFELLDRSGIAIDGKRLVIIGASPVVGRPLALMALHRNATVTVCHIYTQCLSEYTRAADIIIAAAGKPHLVRAEMVSAGAVVIDVGINITADGQIIGDVDFEQVRQVAGAVSRVPGGVGPLTNLMIMRQVLDF